MKRRENSKATATTLASMEIIFEKDEVPDAEVKTCCYWEYARESKFIHSIRERCRQIKGSDLNMAERDKIVGSDFMRMFGSLGRVAILFQEDIYGLGGTNNYDIVSPFPQPWQSLTLEMRRILMETAAWTPEMLIKWKPFHFAHPARALALAKHIETVSQQKKTTTRPNYFAIGQRSRQAARELPAVLYHEDIPGFERPGWMYANGHETLAVEIEWDRFSNDQIVSGFRKWVRMHRPKGVKAPSGQGSKISDWRAALNRLGMMRALNAFTLADHRFPQSLKGREDKACYAARKEAGKTFKRLFPFLLDGEEPIHWKTKGGKSTS